MKRRQILSVDFDGVLHPTTEGAQRRVAVPHFGWVQHLEQLLASHPEVMLLIHSTWRHTHDLEELRLLLGDTLGPRVVAAAPAGDSRWRAIQEWAGEQTYEFDLLILDDQPDEFPETMPFLLIACDPSAGLSDPWVQRSIKQWLEQPQSRGIHDEHGFPRKRADVDLEGAPATRDFLERHRAMWPSISSSVPPGWDDQIAGALTALLGLSIETGVEIRVAQIKSKFAGLRFHFDIDEDSSGPVEVDESTPICTRLQSSSTPSV